MEKRILVIIPAYNEEECLLNTYQTIAEYNATNGTNYDVLVINDCSTDSTPEICRKNHISMISLVHNLGIGGAVQTGYKYARDNNYDIAIQYDGDGQHDVRYIENIIQPLLDEEADVVVGSRFIDKDASEFKSSAARRLGIKIISLTMRIVTGKRLYDVTSGFRAANRRVIEDFAKSYPVDFPEPITNTELFKKHYRLKEVPVAMKERAGGQSSIHSWKSVYFMFNVVLAIIVVGLRRLSDGK